MRGGMDKVVSERREGRVFRRVALQPRRGPHRQPEGERGAVHRAGLLLLPAARRSRRLAVDGGDRVPGSVQGAERRDREIRAAQEGEAQPPTPLRRRGAGHAPEPGRTIMSTTTDAHTRL